MLLLVDWQATFYIFHQLCKRSSKKVFCVLGEQSVFCMLGQCAAMKLDVQVLANCFDPRMTELQHLGNPSVASMSE